MKSILVAIGVAWAAFTACQLVALACLMGGARLRRRRTERILGRVCGPDGNVRNDVLKETVDRIMEQHS